MKIAITGANGHLGVRLIGELFREHEIVALVRSESAVQAIRAHYGDGVSCAVVDYTDAKSLATAINDAEALVHLVGIIKESSNNAFYAAHQATSLAIVAMIGMLADPDRLQHIVYLSLLGVDRQSTNPCFASRAAAEEILAKSQVPVSIIRVPMVLGEGDFASGSLAKKVNQKVCFILRGESLEQPIYAGDVIKAIISRLHLDTGSGTCVTKPVSGSSSESATIELAGSESLTRKQLTERAAACAGNKPVVISVHQSVITMLAYCLEKFSANPPVTRAMLGVLDHDDNIDIKPALAELNISLTTLDETLSKVLVETDKE